MAKPFGSRTTIVLLIAFLLIASLAMPVVEGKEGSRGCKQASKSFTGACKDHPECDKKCKGEKAKSGLCRGDGKAKKCWCYMC